MTTAHRPTWKAAVGREAEGGFAGPSTARSVLDENAHTKLKLRTGHQAVTDRAAALKESLRKLEEAERRSASRRAVPKRREVVPAIEAAADQRLLRLKAATDADVDVDEEALKAKGYDDADEVRDDDDDDDDDADAESDSDLDASDSDEDDDSDDDSEDDEAALREELARIRAEREAKAEAEAAAEEARKTEEAALSGNPLLNPTSSSSSSAATGRLKRRWNDDVVFRNQARDEPDRNTRRFINDTVRNDFHRRFLDKFIK